MPRFIFKFKKVQTTRKVNQDKHGNSIRFRYTCIGIGVELNEFKPYDRHHAFKDRHKPYEVDVILCKYYQGWEMSPFLTVHCSQTQDLQVNAQRIALSMSRV